MHNVTLYSDRNFNDCFRNYYRQLCYFALRYVPDTEKTEDIVQEVFVHLLEGELKFNDEEHVKRWLYTAVRNACLNHIKLSGIRSGILSNIRQENGKQEEETDFFDGIVRAEVYAKILAAVEELPSECRKVFKLTYMEGLENEVVAEKLGISINTVKSQKNKAKIQLREKLRDLYPVALLILHLI